MKSPTKSTIKVGRPKSLKGFSKLPIKQPRPSLQQAKSAVDVMGTIDAKIAPWKTRRDVSRNVTIAFSQGHNVSIDGKKYRASVSYSYPERYDAKKLRAFLTPRQLRACRLPIEEVVTVRVVSLKSAGVKRK